MKTFSVATLAALALAPSALARVFFVQVGAEYQRFGFRAEERTQVVRFQPNTVFAEPGDVIRFQMIQVDHLLSEARLDTPCTRRENGFSSGLVRNQYAEQVQTWDVLITDNGPRSFFDETDNFCQLGNFFSVNPRGNPFNNGNGYNGGFNGNNGFNGGFGSISGTQSARGSQTTSSSSTSVANSTQIATAATTNFIVASGSSIPTATNFFGNNNQVSTTGTSTGTGSTSTNTATSASASIISTLTNGVTVATGTGTTSNGDQCSCQCLCGSESFGSGQGVGNFGGIGAGVMPSMIGVM